MPSRNIAVQKSVYDALSREKRAGESFTSVLRRLLEQREGVDDLYESWARKPHRQDLARLRSVRQARRRAP